jgi:hypothetical protein
MLVIFWVSCCMEQQKRVCYCIFFRNFLLTYIHFDFEGPNGIHIPLEIHIPN